MCEKSGYDVIRVPCPEGFDYRLPGGDNTHTALYANSLMMNKRILVATFDQDGLEKYNADPMRDSREAWQICMRGHAAANFVPVVASNRIGTESSGNSSVTFYGASFIAGSTGRLLAKADRSAETAITAELNLADIKANRSAWGFFRDRRPEMYQAIMTLDGDIDQND